MATNPRQLPFKEAIDFFKNKTKLPTSGWTDIWQQQHIHAFVVAGAATDALVEDFYNALIQAKTVGGGYDEFKQSFQDIATKHGWSYNGAPGWRSRIIYDTNITQSYNAGRYQQMMAVKHLRPFWEYDHTSIEHPRLEHKAWDGLVLPADDVWWDSHYPQNGWGCKCRVRSLTTTEAEKNWQLRGKTGPDQAPPIEWEDKVVGKNGSNPRTVQVPKGIDPGFAYNPGKAYLEPHTVPPLTGYDAVLKQRDKPWPTGFKIPELPTPTKVSPNILLPADIAPEAAVDEFLSIFGATMDTGVAFEDAAGSTLAITKAILTDADAEQLKYVNLMAMALIEPDEIWWVWVKDQAEDGRWRLKRRYLRAFTIDGQDAYIASAFEWGRTGWTGSSTVLAKDDGENAFDNLRNGRLVYKK